MSGVPSDPCSHCRGVLTSTARFCPQCGQPVSAAEVPPPAPPAPATASPQEWLCRCGASNPANVIACRRCGADPQAADYGGGGQPVYASALHRLLQVGAPQGNPAPPVPAVAPTVPEDLACPSCGNGSVQRVSAIVHAGSWSGRSSGLSVGLGHISGGPNFETVGTTAARSAGSTALAQLLAPPDKPDTEQSPERVRMQVLGILAIICFFAAMIGFSQSSVFSGIGWLGLAALFGGCCWLAVRRTLPGSPEYERLQEQIRQWSRRRERWDSLFYCSRCDCVFDPEGKTAVPVRRMHSLLG